MSLFSLIFLVLGLFNPNLFMINSIENNVFQSPTKEIPKIKKDTIFKDNFLTIVQTQKSLKKIENEENEIVLFDLEDTIQNQIKNSKRFKSFKDVILFVHYMKTQSHKLDDDNWACIQTMFNRMDKDMIDWISYFNTPKYNNSGSIEKIKNGKLKKLSFDRNNPTDIKILERVIKADKGFNPTNCPSNVCYFESNKKSPNRNVFKLKNLWKQYIHKFYFSVE